MGVAGEKNSKLDPSPPKKNLPILVGVVILEIYV